MTILEWRKKKKLTQGECAKIIGVSLVTFQMWEREVTTPSEENALKLREVMANEHK